MWVAVLVSFVVWADVIVCACLLQLDLIVIAGASTVSRRIVGRTHNAQKYKRVHSLKRGYKQSTDRSYNAPGWTARSAIKIYLGCH